MSRSKETIATHYTVLYRKYLLVNYLKFKNIIYNESLKVLPQEMGRKKETDIKIWKTDWGGWAIGRDEIDHVIFHILSFIFHHYWDK